MDAETRLTDYYPPGGREPPSEVVLALREVDPRTELVYIGRGRWLLGKVEQDSEKRGRAIRAMAAWEKLVARFNMHEHELPLDELLPELFDRWNEKRLQVMGFCPATIFVMEIPDSTIVEYWKRADWLWKFAWAEFEREQIARADGTADLEERREEMRARFNQIHKSVHRHVFSKSTSRTVTADIQPDGSLKTA